MDSMMDDFQERRLYKLRGGQEDEWRELWVFGYVFVAALWLVVSPHIAAYHFPWSLRVHPMSFLNRHAWRLYKHFANADRLPHSSHDPFQNVYLNGRPHLYSHLLISAPFRAHRAIIGTSALALMLSWFMRSAYYIRTQYDYLIFDPDAVLSNIRGAGKVHQVFLLLCSVVLTFFLALNMSRLYRIMDLAWKVQGRISDTAILFGLLLMPSRSDHRVQHSLYKINRLLNLLHVFAYEEVSENVRELSKDMGVLKRSHLIEESEVQLLEDAENRISVIFVWLSDLGNRLVESQIVSRDFAPSILDALTELLGLVVKFQNEATDIPPVAATHVMQYMVDLACFLTPFLLVGMFDPDDGVYPTYFWPWAGSILVTMFLQGMVSIIHSLELPFDDHLDGLNADWALCATERQIYCCLAGAETVGPADAVGSLDLLESRSLAPESIPASDVAAAISSLMASHAAVTADDIHKLSADHDHGIHGAEADAGFVPQVKKEHVPMETQPLESSWVAREGSISIKELEHGEIDPTVDRRTARAATLDMDILQATRSALLVPREICLDKVSQNRLESVTARPLSELAAALLAAEPVNVPMPEGEPLALSAPPRRLAPPSHRSAEREETNNRRSAEQLREYVSNASNESNRIAADDLKGYASEAHSRSNESNRIAVEELEQYVSAHDTNVVADAAGGSTSCAI